MIITVNPEEVMKSSNSLFYMIVLTSKDGTYLFDGETFVSSTQNKGHGTTAVSSEDLIKSYQTAKKIAEGFFPNGGKLDIAPMPIM